jgi:polar amino acid transport system substrate-binding protein
MLCLLLLPPCLQAQELRVVCAEIAPFCFTEKGVGRGYIYEIGQEIMRRQGKPVRIEIQPLARALINVQQGKQVISLWVGRIPEREKTVHWITPVVNDAFYVFTLKGMPEASTIEKAQQLGRLGAAIAGANVVAAQHSALAHIETTASEDSNGLKLLSGRINGWIGTNATVSHFIVSKNRTQDEFVRGVKLADYTAYIAASLDLDEGTADDWKRTYQAMRKDGAVQMLMKKYGITER